MAIDLQKALQKGLQKNQLRKAFEAGGKYYLKEFGRGNIPKKNIGDIVDFEDWYNKQKH